MGHSMDAAPVAGGTALTHGGNRDAWSEKQGQSYRGSPRTEGWGDASHRTRSAVHGYRSGGRDGAPHAFRRMVIEPMAQTAKTGAREVSTARSGTSRTVVTSAISQRARRAKLAFRKKSPRRRG